MTNAVVAIKHNPERRDLEWTLQIVPATAYLPLEVAIASRKDALDWFACMREITQRACALESQHKLKERQNKIAHDMSNLIIYCQSIAFNSVEEAKCKKRNFYEMSSFPETKAEKLMCQLETAFFLKYHQLQFSRVYPKYRLDSSNYNPINIWNTGCQMVALNYQTGSKPMQLNQAKFRDNGNCGYLLKPDFMFKDDFDPYNKNTLGDTVPLQINLNVIAARHLCRSKKGTASPLVEVQIIGASFDSGTKLITKSVRKFFLCVFWWGGVDFVIVVVAENGFNPHWNQRCEFEVANPAFALIRFLVQDVDVFGEKNFIGQATYPVRKRFVWRAYS